jgi:DNA-directed RNA polymerase omega subunit
MTVDLNIESILKIFPDRYKVCVAASQRAKSLCLGDAPLIETKHQNNALIALEEIVRGKIRIESIGASPAETQEPKDEIKKK